MDDALKNRYPFRLGTTSFIYPADYASNVQQLAPFFDEIELLFFESNHLPSRREIGELHQLALRHDIRYNVHLPVDMDPASNNLASRQEAVTSIARAIERAAPLRPTTLTLHLPIKRDDTGVLYKPDCNYLDRWQSRAMKSLSLLLDTSGVDAKQISVETLDFPPTWLKPIADELNLSICVDVGHMILHGFDLDKVLGLFEGQTTMLHLHGVMEDRDHLSVGHLAPDDCKTISRYLQGFEGSVSLEVFNLQHLEDSMARFPGIMGNGNTDSPS